MILKAVTLLTAAALGWAGFQIAPKQGNGYCKHHYCPPTTTGTTSTTVPITTTIPTTTTLPTTTTNLPSPPSGQLYSADSPWNTPITDGTLDQGSSLMISGINTTNGVIQWKRWGVAFYYANAQTPRYEVADAQSGMHLTIPIPANVYPAAGSSSNPAESDAHLSIIDNDPSSPTYNCEYDMWHAGTVGGSGTAFNYTNPSAGAVQRTKITDSGWIHGASVRGASSTGLGGAITSTELANGNIPHALAFVVDAARADNGQPYLPSYTSDGTNTSLSKIPESARLRLNPNYDASALPLYWQTIATALKTYGAYVVDQGGNLGIEAIDNSHSGIGPAYPWGTTDYPSVPASLIQNLQVLQLGATTTETYDTIATHPCGNFH